MVSKRAKKRKTDLRRGEQARNKGTNNRNWYGERTPLVPPPKVPVDKLRVAFYMMLLVVIVLGVWVWKPAWFWWVWTYRA